MNEKKLAFALVASVAGSSLMTPSAEAQISYETSAQQTLPRNTLGVRLIALDAQGNPLGDLHTLKSNPKDPSDAFFSKPQRSGSVDFDVVSWFQQKARLGFLNAGLSLNAVQQRDMERQIENLSLDLLRLKPDMLAKVRLDILASTQAGDKIYSVTAVIGRENIAGVDTLVPRRTLKEQISDYAIAAPVLQLTSTPQTDRAANTIAQSIVKACGFDQGLQPLFAQAVHQDLNSKIGSFQQQPQNYTYQFDIEKLKVRGLVQTTVGLEQNQTGLGFVSQTPQAQCVKVSPNF